MAPMAFTQLRMLPKGLIILSKNTHISSTLNRFMVGKNYSSICDSMSAADHLSQEYEKSNGTCDWYLLPKTFYENNLMVALQVNKL